MKAVRSAFEAQGLAPRDMIDVQGALWVVHNYKEEDAASFSREAIEAAMDAYDSYRHSGEHAAIFDAFGEPRDYWVRSTRDRPNRIYPSKPVVGFLRGKTELNGGWGQKSDAAAQLHNAGYIIVDAEYSTIAELAEREGIAPSYMTRVLRLTLLAPEIVEAILDGKQGPEVTLSQCLEPLPPSWSEQTSAFRHT